MPVYEYLCDKCNHEFEREQRITEDPVKTCPECRSRKVRRLISRTAFVLKGGGWYSDLYSSSKSDKKGSESAGDSSASSGEKSGDSGAKPGGDSAKSGGDKKSDGSDSKKKSKGKSTKAA